MPWKIVKNGTQFCVIKESDGTTEKCHPTKAEAEAHMAALYANEGKAAKIGRVISAATMGKIQAAHDTLSELGAACKKGKSIEAEDVPMDIEKSVITYGGAVKATALDNGAVKFYGPLVTFSDENTPDLTGDFFTKDTDFGDAETSDVWFNHRFPITADGKTIEYKDRLGKAKLTHTDVGIFAETILKARNEYEQMIIDAGLAGILGWSSGTAAHLVDRNHTGKAFMIKAWQLGLDASLTPCPAEPRNMVIPLKSFLGVSMTETQPTQEAEAAQSAQKAEGKVEVNSQGVNTMELTPEQLQEITDKAANAAVKAFVAAQPSEKPPEVDVVTDEADNALKGGWKFPGEFFMAVKAAAISPSEIDKRLLPLKGGQGANEAIPSEGGFLVDQTVAPGIFERMYDQGTLLAQFNVDPIGPNANGMVYNTVDETSRATGSRWGGIRGYWMAEGGTKTASQPLFAQVSLKLKKVAALCYATDELLEDASALSAWINRVVPDELRFLVEDSIINGNGVGKPLGFVSSPAFITQGCKHAAAAAISAADLAAVWARRWVGAKDYIWLIDQSYLPGLMALTVGNFPVYMPPNGFQGTPASVLFGRPVFEVEYLPNFGAATGPAGIMLVAPSQYALIGKGGVQAASSIHVSFATDETAFRFVYRIDGAPMWNHDLTPFSGGDTVSPFVALGSTSS